jgi:hypothetical protein
MIVWSYAFGGFAPRSVHQVLYDRLHHMMYMEIFVHRLMCASYHNHSTCKILYIGDDRVSA